MAVRVREDGRILCAAMHPALPTDRAYIDDGLHYKLSVELGVLVSEPMECQGGHGGHAKHGQWWWRNEVPDDVEVESPPLERDLDEALEMLTKRRLAIVEHVENLREFDAWLSFRPEFAEVLKAFRSTFGTDTSACPPAEQSS